MLKDTSSEVSFVMICTMTPIPFWQHFDLVSLSVLTVFVSILIVLQVCKKRVTPVTISQSVASSPKSSLAFSIIMTIFFPLYYCFLWFWVGPYISAPVIFYVLLTLSFVAELIFVWAPANGKTKLVHSISAGTVGVLMLLSSIIIFVAAINVSDIARISITVFWVTSVIAALSLLKRYRKYTFVAELLFCAGFLIMMSIVARI